MTSKERVRAVLNRSRADRVPLDFGGTFVTGIHVSCVAGLREHYGLGKVPVKVLDPGQMLGDLGEDLKRAIGVDVEGVFRRTNRWGFANENWKTWRMYDGLEVLVPGEFNTTLDEDGGTLIHPGGDRSAPPSGKMPKDGYFFDNLVRQPPIDEDRLDPKDNLEEFQPIAAREIQHLADSVKQAAATGRAVVAGFGGTALGDIGAVPGPSLKNPKGIRDVTEWYISTRARREYVHAVFAGETEIALANLEKIHAAVGDTVDAVYVCGTDFGTQTSSFCSVATFRELYLPYYKQINGWIHRNTGWKTFKHSCGAVEKFLDSFIEAGFDILNPVQCSAAGMEPEHLKNVYGGRLIFWGGGVDTQRVLPFGSPEEVREQVLRRCEVFAKAGGMVFTSIHNIQAGTPIRNIVAMIDAVHEFNG